METKNKTKGKKICSCYVLHSNVALGGRQFKLNVH